MLMKNQGYNLKATRKKYVFLVIALLFFSYVKVQNEAFVMILSSNFEADFLNLSTSHHLDLVVNDRVPNYSYLQNLHINLFNL